MKVIPVDISSELVRQAFVESWNKSRNALERLLAGRWTNMSYKEPNFPGEFEVSGDFNYSWTLHGAVLSRRMLTGEFVQTLRDFLKASKMEDGNDWAVDFVFEIFGEERLLESKGEFLLIGDTLYLPCDDHFDYAPFAESVRKIC